jgi:hypothetical protein
MRDNASITLTLPREWLSAIRRIAEINHCSAQAICRRLLLSGWKNGEPWWRAVLADELDQAIRARQEEMEEQHGTI